MYILVKLHLNREEEIFLPLPEEADFDEKKISLLAPLGVALLGCKTGDAVNYKAPGGTAKIASKRFCINRKRWGNFFCSWHFLKVF